MRLFVAVPLDPPAREAVAGAIDALRRHPVLRAASIKWVEARNLHLTLQFLGTLEADAATAAAAALTPVSALPAFRAALGAFGVFPPRGAPRVIWVGVREGARALGALRDEVARRLAPLGCIPEGQAYRPHLTVGRVRRGGSRLRAATTTATAGSDLRQVAWCVGRAVLFESRLSAAGPSYRVVTEMRLAGARGPAAAAEGG